MSFNSIIEQDKTIKFSLVKKNLEITAENPDQEVLKKILMFIMMEMIWKLALIQNI